MTDTKYSISSGTIDINHAMAASSFDSKVYLTEESMAKVKQCRDYLDDRLGRADELLYGINTGFGSLCNVKVEKSAYGAHQKRLVVSHACGLGDAIPIHIARLIFYLKIKNLSFEHKLIYRGILFRYHHQ